MAETLILSPTLDRETRYRELLPQIAATVAHESDPIANLANIAAMLKEAFGFFWVGFYRVLPENEQELVLGPFQGPMACTRIAFSRGVCGACATQQRTIVVPDVEKFPGHIACSSFSKSEIVVPLIRNGRTLLVLDIDSDTLNDFSEVDAQYLEEMMALL
jgi:GAF domain-containing protein